MTKVTYKKIVRLATQLADLESDNPDWENCLILAQGFLDELIQKMEKEIEDKERLE